MPVLDRGAAALVVVDLQARLMPAIADGEAVVANARRLLAAASLLDIPAVATEQNPRGLGATVADLPMAGVPVVSKMFFDGTRAPGFFEALPERPDLVVIGCEAHVCVLQTVLGLLASGRTVRVAADAVGSRRPASRDAALARMERHGAEIVTTEMAIFEWLGTAEHPAFREAVALIK